MEIEDVDNNEEINLVLEIVTSDKICKTLMPILNRDFFENFATKTIYSWTEEYFNNYNLAPKKHLQDIFSTKKEFLEESKSVLLEEFISVLSFELKKKDKKNEDYLTKKFYKWIKKRELEINNNKINGFVSLGDIDKAYELAINFKKDFNKTLATEDISPFSKEEIIKYFFEEDEKELFKFKGYLGNLVGPLKRGWLVSFLAPMKRGKSWFLLESAFNALINRHKVIFISLEMDETSIKERMYKRIISTTKEGGNILYPCFDCYKNQLNDCDKSKRRNRISLFDEFGNKPEFRASMKYEPCTKCRGTYDYFLATWFKSINRQPMNITNFKKAISSFDMLYNKDNIRVQCYPKFSANVDDIFGYLQTLETVENFIPNVIVIDYADILNSSFKGSERGIIDDTWKKLGKLALEKNCLVVTASQSNRNSISAKSVKQEDTAEDIRKIAHVDIMIGLNQTLKEKREKVARINLVAHRHKEFDENVQAIVLQQLAAGQPIFDSEKLTIIEE